MMSILALRAPISLAFLTITLIAGCDDDDGLVTPVGGDPQGVIWLLTRWEGDLGLENIAELDVSAQFADSGVAGYGACNWYGATCSYSADGQITVRQIGSTERGCISDRHQTMEGAFFDALSGVQRFGRVGHQLYLYFETDDQEGVMIFAAVNETDHWPYP